MKRAAVVLAAVLLLAGCAAPSTGGDTDPSAAPDTSDSGDSGDTGIATEIPATFPAGIPLIDGEVAAGIDVGTGWSVVIKTDDLAAAYADASTKLKGAGFTADTETDSGAAGAFGQFQNAEFTVQVTAADSMDYGPSVTYLVVIK